jgi:hypothetical protein
LRCSDRDHLRFALYLRERIDNDCAGFDVIAAIWTTLLKLKFWQRNADNDEGMAGDAVEPDIKVPLKMRVRARWEGYDDPMEYFMLQGELDAYREWLRRMMVRAARPIEEELGELDLEDEAGRWPPERLKFYAKLFDRGIMMPGGAEYALDLAKPLALDETMSCLEIGSRIGGAARLLADKFGVWVTAFEQDAELAAIGMDRSTATGVQKKVPVMHFDASNPDIRKKILQCGLFVRRALSDRAKGYAFAASDRIAARTGTVADYRLCRDRRRRTFGFV